MSLMFPTIYGIALQGLGDDAKFGAAGLIMAILGGSILPPVQASIIDCGTLMGMPAVNLSFLLPFICFVVIVIYGHRSYCRGENAKVIIDTSEFNSREPFIEKKGSLFYLYSCSSSFFATFVLQNKTSKIFRIT